MSSFSKLHHYDCNSQQQREMGARRGGGGKGDRHGPNIYRHQTLNVGFSIKICQQRYLTAGVYLSEAPDPQPPPPPPVTHCMNIEHIPVYMYLFTQGRGGGSGEPVRRLEGR
jgi:hypothetical protein